MQELDHQVLAAAASSDATKKKSFTSEGRKSVKFKDSGEAERCRVTEWMIPHTANIVCAGLACVDMQLLQASGGDGGENIESFAGENTIGGGSVSMACKTLSRLCHGSPLDDDYMQVTPGVVNSIIPLCKIGTDDAGNKLLKLLEDAGSSCRNVDVSHLRKARKKDVNARTALAVLPIYKDGRRGCFFDAASNVDFTASDLVEMMEDFKEDESSIDKRGVSFGAFLFGYPHLLPKMQGEALAHILSKARLAMEDGGIIAVDLNGVPGDSDDASSSPWGSLCSVAYLQADPVLGPALSHIDILHMNEGEIGLLTGIHVDGTDSSEASDDIAISTAVSLFLKCGIAVVAVTRGKRGCYIACNNQQRFASSKMLPPSWAGCQVKVPATELPDGTEINSNGAGDAFTCGLLVAAMLRHTGLYIPLKSMVNDETIDRKEDDSSDYKNNESQSMESELNNTTATSSNSSNIDTTNTSSSSSSAANNKKITPYTLYMKEKFVALKAELKGDKKAIFMKCHDMWENETEDVKEMYERKCREEESVVANNNVNDDTSSIMDQSLQSGEDEVMNPNDNDKNDDDGIVPSIDPRLANRTMNLETAAQFACLVAARHVDTSTRDLNYLDLDSLLAQSSVSQVGLEEI
jgi:sugar/nucleoside kinase (ribokinase family)